MVWSCVEFHFSLRATRDWKSESVTDKQTYLRMDGQRTWVGARDTCVSKNQMLMKTYTCSHFHKDALAMNGLHLANCHFPGEFPFFINYQLY